MQNVNRVIVTGNLTRDPELRATTSTTACTLRIAVNGRRKNNETGQWEDQPNYFDVTVFGAQGENCERYLSKGSPVAIDGRLDWREWTSAEGQKRQAVQIIAESVQFLGSREENGGSSSAGSDPEPSFATPAVSHSTADDDIPF